MRIRFSFPIFFSSLTCCGDMRLWPFLYQGSSDAVLFFLSNETLPNLEIRLKRPQEMFKEDYKSAFFRYFLWQCFQERKCNLAAHKCKNRSFTHLYVAKLLYLCVYVLYIPYATCICAIYLYVYIIYITYSIVNKCNFILFGVQN